MCVAVRVMCDAVRVMSTKMPSYGIDWCEYMTDERRNQRRVSTSIEVVWEGNSGRYESRTSDLSAGGCFVDTVGTVTMGEDIKFTLLLPAGESIEIVGEVVYSYPPVGFGVQFTNVSEADRQKIRRIIEAAVFQEDQN
jgi:Tfp pilus assembly protein PilZ